VRGLGKGHFLTIAVDIVVARNAEDFFARDGGRRRQFIEERDSKFVLGGVLVGNSRSDILVVQPAQNWHRQRLTDGLDGAGDRRVLLQ